MAKTWLAAPILTLIVVRLATSLTMGASMPAMTDFKQADEQFTHLVVLVHGFKGSEQDFAYLETTFERQAHEDANIVLHKSSCNSGKTTDGIESGGKRLAAEVEEQIKKIEGPVRLSFVANSLGGLYVRYAIAHIDMTGKTTPLVYCTTSTPHLGCCNHTYITIPRWAETTIGNMMAQTGRDLFCDSTIVKELGTSDFYLGALRKFKQRVAIANAFATDILVPVTTAAFLSKTSDYPHTTIPDMKQYLLAVQTDPIQEFDKEDASQCLDSLGWIKLFLDMSGKMPLPSVPLPFRRPTTIPDQPAWTSRELFPILSRVGSRWEIPLGHTVAIANSRNKLLTIIAEKGKPVMDQVAKDLLILMGVPLSITTSVEQTEKERTDQVESGPDTVGADGESLKHNHAVATTLEGGVSNEDIIHGELATESSRDEAAFFERGDEPCLRDKGADCHSEFLSEVDNQIVSADADAASGESVVHKHYVTDGTEGGGSYKEGQ